MLADCKGCPSFRRVFRLLVRIISRQMLLRQQQLLFQNALLTRAGTECLTFLALTDSDERATILSFDGMGVFDLISRESKTRGLLEVGGGGKRLKFVRQFCGSPLGRRRGNRVHIPQCESFFAFDCCNQMVPVMGTFQRRGWPLSGRRARCHNKPLPAAAVGQTVAGEQRGQPAGCRFRSEA